MALYIGGSEKLKIILNEAQYNFNVIPKIPTTDNNFVKLLSSDNYILKDINELYLTAKESE